MGADSRPGRVTSRLGKDETNFSERLHIRHIIEGRTGRLGRLGVTVFTALGSTRRLCFLFRRARPQHLHLAGDDLDYVAILTFLVLPFASLDATFDVDRRSLLEILANDLGHAVEEDDTVPFGSFLAFAGRLVLVRLRRRDSDRSDRFAILGIANLGIGP